MDNFWSRGGGPLGSVESDSEKRSSYKVPVTRRSDMDETWRETAFGTSTFRHPFQLTVFSSASTPTPVSPARSSTLPPSMDNSSLPTQSQTISTSQHRHQRRQSLSFFYPSRSLNPTPVSFSRREDSSFIQTILIPLACFIPIPPLLSLLYLVVGQAVLSIQTVPIVSSLKSGVVGGAILALPLTIILYLVCFPTAPSSLPENTGNPLDFFDDDESRQNHLVGSLVSFCQPLLWRYTGQALIIVCMGVATGPLGVTVLSTASQPRQYLTAGQAAKSGLVGGLILSPAVVGLVVGVLIWSGRWRSAEEASDSP